jgi:hypothetical protein
MAVFFAELIRWFYTGVFGLLNASLSVVVHYATLNLKLAARILCGERLDVANG